MRYLILLLLFSCVKEDKSIQVQEPVQALAMVQCDSVYYLPVYSGRMMKILPRTIVPWNYKGQRYWFAKGYAFSIVDPFNYQQDSLKERVVFSDTVMISYSDTFYICKKYFK